MTKLFLQETIRAFLNVQLDKSFKGDFFCTASLTVNYSIKHVKSLERCCLFRNLNYINDTDTHISRDFIYTWYYTFKYSEQLIM